MKNRRWPFGYRMEMGELILHTQEAEVVRWIFNQYCEGMAYNSLVDKLNGQPIPYDEDKPWNKNMVARMLEDCRYIGEKGYPAIISAETFDTARKIRDIRKAPAKSTGAEKILRQLSGQRRTKTVEVQTLAKRAGGVVDPLPEDAPYFVKDYYDYYKTERGYTERSLNSNNGWNVTSSLSFINMPILKYSNEIRSAVLIIHGEKAHSCYFSRDAYAAMVNGNPYADNKELLIIPDAVHTDLYDNKNIIPFDKIECFFQDAFEMR